MQRESTTKDEMASSDIKALPLAIAMVTDIAIILGCVFIFGWMQGRDEADRRAAYAEFVSAACLPRTIDQRAIARLDAQHRLHCTITDHNGWGRVPLVVAEQSTETPTP